MAELTQYVFFDFEMLCSNKGMLFEDMEAIRLGAVKYDLLTEELSFFDEYIKPENHKPLSMFCKRLTGIEDKDLRDADGFADVFTTFLYWVNGVKKTRFYSWSKSDLSRLNADAARHGIPAATIEKINSRYVDFQEVFSNRAANNTPSVENALGLYGLDFVGETHNPMFDSYNTLRIFFAFERNPQLTEKIMAERFILPGRTLSIDQINVEVKSQFAKDMEEFFSSLQWIYKMKEAQQLVKRAKRICKRYKNVAGSTSGIFDEELRKDAKDFILFYEGLKKNYLEHITYSSRILILDEENFSYRKLLLARASLDGQDRQAV
ncbi:3'-5' exonuclease [Bacillus infantis]|uniref:3'-5' exonuclease n=1 Tax=Bacillus infantis TaxID=324767 RepID=UPI002155850B|nr:3'-5' exonuclease [Bacillus infantis]MCR6610905.1 exonuclease domain-containing protein [Bacillus infantis]